MRLIYTFIFICFASHIHAQHVLLHEQFSGSVLSSGWNNSQHTGPAPWAYGEMYLVNGSVKATCLCYNKPNAMSYRKVAGISDCSTFGNNNMNDLLYTPPINTTGRNTLWLEFSSFFTQYTFGAATEKATVEISTDAGLNWTVIQTVSPNVSLSDFTTYQVDISSYKNMVDVRIGFRYSDGGGIIMSGWAIDDVKVFEPAQKDAQLLSVSPFDEMQSYIALNNSIPHTYIIYNAGLDTIHDITLHYKQENSIVKHDTITNLNIPSFHTQKITHSIPDTLLYPGKYGVTAWVETAGDTIHANDTQRTAINGTYFMPSKMVTLEEGTGTWHVLAPRGHVYMKQVEGGDYNVCQVSVHDNDPMTIPDYNSWLYNIGYNYVPYFMLDRTKAPEHDSLFVEILRRQNYFAYADILIGAYVDGSRLSVKADIKPAIDLKGDFRAVLVITEDNVTGTGEKWNQKNGFAGGALGAMGGYESKPNPVPATDMIYNYVARAIMPSAEGKSNLPKTMTHETKYTVSFDTTLNTSWNKNKLRAAVLLIRGDDSTILNSNKVPFYLSIPSADDVFANATLYPNPANEHTILSLQQAKDVHVFITDISGRVIIDYGKTINNNHLVINTGGLITGIYFVNLQSGNGRKTLKLQVSH